MRAGMGSLKAACAALLAGALLSGCAATKEPSAPTDEALKAPMDKILARMVSKGEIDRAVRTADSLSASREPAEREIAAYWKTITWFYRGEPDSALAVLEGNQGKWTGGLRKVHAALLLGLARDATQSRVASRVRHEDPAARPVPDKSLQDRVDALQKENGDLRAENARLETEKEKYQKLLKDLETIR
ncbi:MAG: hypothetical protein JWP91_4180 [Fibrobacteres bacterium]|nr:hypothetical protein [Fibrobacterota bacterium]